MITVQYLIKNVQYMVWTSRRLKIELGTFAISHKMKQHYDIMSFLPQNVIHKTVVVRGNL